MFLCLKDPWKEETKYSHIALIPSSIEHLLYPIEKKHLMEMHSSSPTEPKAGLKKKKKITNSTACH